MGERTEGIMKDVATKINEVTSTNDHHPSSQERAKARKSITMKILPKSFLCLLVASNTCCPVHSLAPVAVPCSKNRRTALLWITAASCSTHPTLSVAAAAPEGVVVSPPDLSTANDPSSLQLQLSTAPIAVFVRGRVTLPTEALTATSSSSSPPPALYITCRPAVADNVPEAILSGTRGKPSPVLAARFENPSFPFAFSLTSENLTVEGETGDWWMTSDLLVSARWDSDGIAATRSPDDLVGRGTFRPLRGASTAVEIPLQGRGAFGKFVTKKQAPR